MSKATNIPLGKRVGGALYFHVTALDRLADHLREAVQIAAEKANLEEQSGFNVIKLGRDSHKISLLYYDRFFDDPFPSLKRSCTVDLASGEAKKRTYGQSGNPPILHRKVRELAVKEAISINQFITIAVAEKMSALLTEEYLEERAQRADPAAVDRILSRVPDVPPIPGDE